MIEGDSVLVLNPVDVGIVVPELEHPCSSTVICTKSYDGVGFVASNVPPFGDTFESSFSVEALVAAIEKSPCGNVEIEDDVNSVSYIIRRRAANELFRFAAGMPKRKKKKGAK